MVKVLFGVAFTSILLAVSACAVAQDGQTISVTKIEGDFEDVKERVIFAVESQGLVVDHTSDVGGMLERTGKDLGESSQIYERAVVLEFCSAYYSRLMAEAAPELLAYCPYGISVYTLPGDAEYSYVAFKRIATMFSGSEEYKSILEKIDRLLATIVDEASM
ncbi:MAG: DUF302 domain-containing protein [Betaproteobacteria bacterium]